MTEPPRRDEADAIGLTEADYERFCEFFYGKTGITLDENRRYFVRSRLGRRMRATGYDSFRGYFGFVRTDTDEGELQQLVNEMTVNETYFYREDHQFDCLVRHILPEISARRAGRPIKIWSVPCSTGEEPYSVALHLLEDWRGLAQHDVTILASDIDTSVLAAARKGVYSPRSVGNLPATVLSRYFEPLRTGDFRLSADLRDAVEFVKMNLLDTPLRLQQGDVDVVFCRNLLIYFDRRALRLAV